MPRSKTILPDHSNIKHYGNYKIVRQQLSWEPRQKGAKLPKMNRPLKDNDGVDLGAFSFEGSPMISILLGF